MGMFGSGRTEPLLVIDSHPWVEYFRGTEIGHQFSRLMEKHDTRTPTLVLSEVGFALLRGGQNYGAPLRFIQTRSRVVPLSPEIALLTVEIHREQRGRRKDWPIMDSMILATARHLGGRVVTGDPHFDDLGEEVMFLR